MIVNYSRTTNLLSIQIKKEGNFKAEFIFTDFKGNVLNKAIDF